MTFTEPGMQGCQLKQLIIKHGDGGDTVRLHPMNLTSQETNGLQACNVPGGLTANIPCILLYSKAKPNIFIKALTNIPTSPFIYPNAAIE